MSSVMIALRVGCLSEVLTGEDYHTRGRLSQLRQVD